MDIRLNTIGVEEAAHIMESLSMVMSDSMANGGDLPSAVYADVMELLGDLATAIKREVGCAA